MTDLRQRKHYIPIFYALYYNGTMGKTENWIPQREQYDFVMKQIEEPKVGLRYWRIYALGIIARKLDMPKETFVADAEKIFDIYASDGDSSPFSEEDLMAAIKSYDDPDALSYRKVLLEKLAGISLQQLPRHKERETLAAVLRLWIEDHPYAKIADAVSDPSLGISRRTITEHWKECGGLSPAERMEKWFNDHPDATVRMCMDELGVGHATAEKYYYARKRRLSKNDQDS